MGHLHLDEPIYLTQLRHFLPSQAPLKDFVHHNTLHHYQNLPFKQAIETYFQDLGVKNIYDVQTYLEWYRKGLISDEAIEFALNSMNHESLGLKSAKDWVAFSEGKMNQLREEFKWHPRVKTLKGTWKRKLNLDVDAAVYPILFRWISNYMDQGISVLENERWNKGIWEDFKEINQNSFISLLKHKESKAILFQSESSEDALNQLLNRVVGDESLIFSYLKEQQLMHPGWSGLVSVVEQNPAHLILPRKVRLLEFVALELLLEFDFLITNTPVGKSFRLSDLVDANFLQQTQNEKVDFSLEYIWQIAFEWTYYASITHQIQTRFTKVHGLKGSDHQSTTQFQALFCIDDREGSIRSHIENRSGNKVQTFGIPGFFGIEFFYKGLGMVHASKSCPAPVNPHVLIKENAVHSSPEKLRKDPVLSRNTHKSIQGLWGSMGLGFAAGMKLVKQVLQPEMNQYVASSAGFMRPDSKLTLLHEGGFEDGLQIGFTLEELLVRAENMLLSIDLTHDFASLVYLIGHGASSINNPHYAAYDCGACSGRPGSVNARLMAMVLNLPEIRSGLKSKGIQIPESTRFIGALHDTTRDEVVYYDLHGMPSDQLYQHGEFQKMMEESLLLNAAERMKKFSNVSDRIQEKSRVHADRLAKSQKVEVKRDIVHLYEKMNKEDRVQLSDVHKEVLRRSMRLFETRPEYNHATNSLCVIGDREMTVSVELDRRAFLQSYNPKTDPDGHILHSIMKAAVPVCGGINLEYYFSKVSPDQMGAGSKLPHNVNGLLGVSNGVEGDLRTGLPAQMVEIHDAVRLMMIIQQSPEILLGILNQDSVLMEWFKNEWVHLMLIHPETGQCFYFNNQKFVLYSNWIQNGDFK